jgi:hypothetical protein
MKKNFFLKPDQLRPLTDAPGGAYASDRIVVDGAKVGYMYREAPDHDSDSGWRFLAGDENDEYMNNADSFGIYHINLIANIDAEIVQYLDAPEGSAFIRDESGKLVPDEEDVHNAGEE